MRRCAVLLAALATTVAGLPRMAKRDGQHDPTTMSSGPPMPHPPPSPSHSDWNTSIHSNYAPPHEEHTIEHMPMASPTDEHKPPPDDHMMPPPPDGHKPPPGGHMPPPPPDGHKPPPGGHMMPPPPPDGHKPPPGGHMMPPPPPDGHKPPPGGHMPPPPPDGHMPPPPDGHKPPPDGHMMPPPPDGHKPPPDGHKIISMTTLTLTESSTTVVRVLPVSPTPVIPSAVPLAEGSATSELESEVVPANPAYSPVAEAPTEETPMTSTTTLAPTTVTSPTSPPGEDVTPTVAPVNNGAAISGPASSMGLWVACGAGALAAAMM